MIPSVYLITTCFPPDVGGIEEYCHSLVRELPADSVTVITTPPQYLRNTFSVPDPHRHIARVTVSQRTEILHHSRRLPATGGLNHQSLHDSPVEVAHELRVGLGQLPERAVEEIDPHPATAAPTGRTASRWPAQ